jgi:RNA polymerase sigma factor (sigma-70 family)
LNEMVSGPLEAFEAFYEREFQPVFATVWLLCRDQALTEEIVQEAFARVLERWRRIGREPWRGAYVTSTAVNLVRRRSRRPPADPAVPASQSSAEMEEAMDLWRAVARLPRRERQAVVLFYRLDLPAEQTARAMGCSSATVRAHLTRARQRLRDSLQAREANDGRT